MKLTFLGGADEVGASCILLEITDKKILVDAGIRISPRSSRGIENSQLPDLTPVNEIDGIDFILVTHAHTDHTGALPMIVEQHPHTPVYMTRPTLALTRVLQQDAQRIMKNKQEEEGELPLFDEIAVNLLMEAIEIVEFGKAIKLGEDLVVTYYVAGHIAGAALLVFESAEGTLVISGDVSKSIQRTVKSIEVPRIKSDILVLESTYGGRLHAERRAEELRLIETLKRVTERGGKVLIPAFALGRAQEVIQIILAYRDQFDVPVYVDGMVRSVCDAYNQFSDLLPEKTVKASKGEHLFFRQNVHPIRSVEERSIAATSSTPCVIVASSGMLTGGASVYYAQHFAPHEDNAILLTGYQDEEAPGRFLQRMMRDREEGVMPTVRLADKSVKVRCEVGTYSLSAHADEAELIAITQALKPSEVFLVHGDHGARHSLATGLRRREIVVSTPKIGTTREFSFKGKPWAIGSQIKAGNAERAFSSEALWQGLKDHAGDYFSIRELAQIWWGDGNRTDEVLEALSQPDNIYLAADWRSKRNYKVRSVEQVERINRQRAIMLAHPDLVGKLVVLRNSNDQPRLAVVQEAEEMQFRAKALDARGSVFPADALLWVIGDWQAIPDVIGGLRAQLRKVEKSAQTIADQILPFGLRQKIAREGAIVQPKSLLPDVLPADVDQLTALTAIVLKLAEDGAEWVQDGLKTQQASETGPVDQNQARDIAMSLFPPEANLRKVGMDVHRRLLLLQFDFPHAASTLHAKLIDELSMITGWRVDVKQAVNQQALGAYATQILPQSTVLTKTPSIYVDQQEVHISIRGDNVSADIRKQFLVTTGFKLIVQGDANRDTIPTFETTDDSPQMEINQAYDTIRQNLNDHGLYKVGLKNGRIVLSFISPQVGARHADVIAELAQQTGYELTLHPHPNQQQILQLANELMQENGLIAIKSPSIYVDRGEVSVSVSSSPDAGQQIRLTNRFEALTGFALVFT